MYKLNEKIANLEPYQPIQGQFDIRLDANESYLNIPEDMIKKIKNELSKIDFNRYPDPFSLEVCKAFAEYYHIDEQFVTAGNGSDELISIIISSFFQKKDKLMVLSPDFSMYKFYANIAELEIVELKKNNLIIDVDVIIEEISKKNVAGVIFSNPCNPTSYGMTSENIIKLVKNVNCLVILDEAYMDFWEHSLLDIANEFDNLIILRTSSKMVGLAAIRLGFSIANATITRAIRAVKSPYNVNSISQMIGKIVLSDKQYLDRCKKRLISSRETLFEGLKKLEKKYLNILEIISSDTNFVFLKTSNNLEIVDYLSKNSIAIRHMGEYLRISAGSENENSMLLMQLEKAINYENNNN